MATGYESDEYTDSHCDKCYQKKKGNAFCKTCSSDRFVDSEANHQTHEKDAKYEVVKGKTVSFSQNGPTSYQSCDKHLKSEYYLNCFCRYHSCLVCPKCAKKVHEKCLVVSVQDMSRYISSRDIKEFESDIGRAKEHLVETKSNLHTTMRKRLADQHDAVFDKCEDMFNEQEAKLKCLKTQFQTELEEVFNKQSKIISRQIEAIDTVVERIDGVYREIQTIEKTNKYCVEDFLKIQEIVDKINHNLTQFRGIESASVTVSLEFLANEALNNFMTRVNSLGTLKTRIKCLDSVLRLDNVACPPPLKVKTKDKTRKSESGTWQSFKFMKL